MAREHATAYVMQWSAGQPVGVPKLGGAPLSKSFRPAAETAVMGFHSATVHSGPGSDSAEMKAEEMNVNGNSQIRPALWATSTVGENRPVIAPTQDMANANSRIIAKASTAST